MLIVTFILKELTTCPLPPASYLASDLMQLNNIEFKASGSKEEKFKVKWVRPCVG